MATQTRYASSVVSTSGYVNGANAYSLNDTYATWTSAARNTTAQLVLGIAAFAIPTGATINSVTLWWQRKWSTGASTRIDYSYLQIALGATLRGTQYAESAFPTDDTDASTAGGTWTLSELNGGTMRAYIDTDRTNNTVQTIHSIDAVWVVVDYTEVSLTILPSGIESAEAFGAANLLSDQFLSPSGIASAEAFGAHTVGVPKPYPTDGLVFHVDADAITGLSNNDSVDPWEDLSTGENDAVKNTDFPVPTYKTNRLNGKPGVYFDGTTGLSTRQVAPNANGEHTIFVVTKVPIDPAEVSSKIIFQWGAIMGVYWDLGWSGGSKHFQYRDTDLAWINVRFNNALTNVPFVATGKYDGVDYSVYVNGTLNNSRLGGAANETDWSYMSLGVKFNATAYLECDIYEVMVYTRSLTTTERQEVEAYLMEKWFAIIKPSGIASAEAFGSLTVSQGIAELQNVGQATITPTQTLVKQAMKQVGGGTITPTQTLSKLIYKSVGGSSITPQGSFARLLTKIVTVGQATLTPTQTLLKEVTKQVGSGTITPTQLLSKLPLKNVGQAVITPAQTLSRFIQKSVGSAVVLSDGALNVLLTKLMSVGGAVVTPTQTLLKQTVKQVGSGVITPTQALIKSVSKTVGKAVITPTQTLIKYIQKSVGNATVSVAGLVDALLTKLMLVGGAVITPTQTLVKQVTKHVGGSLITPTQSMVFTTLKVVGKAIITPIQSLSKLLGLTVGEGTVTSSGTISTIFVAIKDVGSGVVTSAGTVGHRLSVSVGVGMAVVSSASTLVKRTSLSVGSAVITASGNVLKRISVGVGKAVVTSIGYLEAIKSGDPPPPILTKIRHIGIRILKSLKNS